MTDRSNAAKRIFASSRPTVAGFAKVGKQSSIDSAAHELALSTKDMAAFGGALQYLLDHSFV